MLTKYLGSGKCRKHGGLPQHHLELTAPFTDQREHKEPYLVSDLKYAPHPSDTLSNDCLSIHCVFCEATAGAKVPLGNVGGGGVWVLSINFPTIFQLSKAQGTSSISYVATERS